MKKIFTAFFAVCLLNAGMHAGAQELSWGPKAGLNIAGMSNSDLNAKLAVTAGVFGHYQVNDLLVLSAEALYSRQGGTFKTTVDGVKTRTWIKSHYLNIPIMAGVYVLDERLMVRAGLQPGFNLGDRQVDKTSGVKTKYDIGNQFKTMDLSIPVGLSYDLGELIIEARYNFGITNALKAGDSKNNVFTLSVGVRL